MRTKMSPARCCCCVVRRDKFDRADGTDLGAGWDERSGAWEIDTEQLGIADDDALVVVASDTPLFSNPIAQYLQVTFEAETAITGKVRLVGNRVDDDNYIYVEADLALTSIWVRLIRRSGGVDTEVESMEALPTLGATGGTLFLCVWSSTASAEFAPNYVGGFLGGTLTANSATTLHTDGWSAGLATGPIDQAIRFDDFSLERHGSQFSRCRSCSVDCFACTVAVPEELVLDLDVGGLTNLPAGYPGTGGCNKCNLIKGEYSVRNPGGCCWTYKKEDHCRVGAWNEDESPCYWEPYFPDSWRLLHLLVTVCVDQIEDEFGDPTGEVRWRAHVDLDATVVDPCDCFLCMRYRTTFYSAPFDPADCNEVPVELAKDFETAAPHAACGGALPATIWLRAG